MPSNSPTPEGTPEGGDGRLYVVATPIGHMDDITLRALKTLREADLIAAEDTRHTGRLLKRHAISTPLISYHEHNERERAALLLERLKGGACVALVSDAGTPSVSDPGYRLVQAAAAEGIRIVPLPGASAAMAAVSASGLPTDVFTFVGFPARRKERRLRQLQALAADGRTLIFFESPRRVVGLLEEIAGVMGDRPAVLGREMTKIHEEFIRGTVRGIAGVLSRRPAVKGECTLVVSGGGAFPEAPADLLDGEIRRALELAGERPSEIARRLSRRFGLPRNRVYAAVMQVKSRDRG